VIPEEWEVQSLGNVVGITTGRKDVNEGNPTGAYPFFTCSRDHTYSNSYSFDSEAILVAGNGDVGNLHYYQGRFEAYQRTYVLRDFKLPAKYIWHQLDHRLAVSLGLGKIGTSIPYIKKGNLTYFAFPMPATDTEQRAIAEALGDVDALLGALDVAIAKQRDLKQATMQQLLTGQTRLPGFAGEWETKQVIDFGRVVTGGTPRTDVASFWGDGYIWITPTDISIDRDLTSSERTITDMGLSVIRELPANTVLITCIASIGKNGILRSRGGCNQQINAVIPNSSFCAEFLYYLFEANVDRLKSKAGTTATSMVSKVEFSKIEFCVPLLAEQKAIAAVLSDIDTALSALESRRTKTAALKQAMMQSLLTGRIRLV